MYYVGVHEQEVRGCLVSLHTFFMFSKCFFWQGYGLGLSHFWRLNQLPDLHTPVVHERGEIRELLLSLV
jgi:hypothetical protein